MAPGPLVLLLGEVPEQLGRLLEQAGARVRVAAGWLDAGDYAEVVALGTASHIRVEERDLARLPRLEILGRAAAGLDNVDVEAAERRGLRVFYASEANAQSAAEQTMALLFAVARRLTYHDDAMRDGGWSRNETLGFELSGRRLGIVGLGRVGSRVARMAGAIPMRLTAYDPYVSDERFAAHGCAKAPHFDDLLDASDVLTFHCPLTPITRGMVGMEQLARLPAGAVVINCARGEVLDESALAQLLGSGQLAGAGIDCWSVEPPPPDHPLLALGRSKLVAAPHIGARTPEARERVAVETAEKMIAALEELGLL